MRTTINISDELYEIVKEMAIAQERTFSAQMSHLAKTSPETIGWRAFKSSPGFQRMLGTSPVKVGE